MLIKSADNHDTELAQLEQLSQSTDTMLAKAAVTELRMRKAGIKGETDSAYLIDFDFGKSNNWAVIHDLRLEHEGRTAQIDHLLIGRMLDCYVLETKHFHDGVKINDDGEFLRRTEFRQKHGFKGMSSPLEQNSRHITVLRDVMQALPLPVRLGFRLNPEFHSFVLVSSTARIDRPKEFDTDSVIKADQLKTRVMGDLDAEGTLTGIRKVAKLISSETLREVAELLAREHRPSRWPLHPTFSKAMHTSSPFLAPSTALPKRVAKICNEVNSAPMESVHGDAVPACKKCHGRQRSIQYGKYGYYFQCATCDTNTAIRFTCLPGHHPRLRKSGLQFYRDCPECKSSRICFTNP